MSCLITFTVVREDGEQLHDETLPCEFDVVDSLEKDFTVLGMRHTLRIEFDPGLRTKERPA